MPELPEVETIRRDLEREVRGRAVVQAQFLDNLLLVGGSSDGFSRTVAGREITGLGRRGKVLMVLLGDDLTLLVHFRMTGRLYVMDAAEQLPRHVRSILTLDDGRLLIHEDLRRLGTLELVSTAGIEGSRTLCNIGPDALDRRVTGAWLMALAAGHRCAIKLFLMDQTHLAGIGNIYASEALHRARMHPETPACDLTDQQWGTLVRSLRETLRDAIQCCGTTLSDYVTGQGVPGEFQKLLRVYDREGHPCRRRGCGGVIVRCVQGQRSTYYCPNCQQGPQFRR